MEQEQISEARTLFRNAIASKKAASELQALTRFSALPVMVAYHAASQALYANHLRNPLKKLPLAQKSIRLFQQAVSSDPDHPEIRFLRRAITANMPSFLRDAQLEAEDIHVFMDQIPEFDQYLIRQEEARDFLQHLRKHRIVTDQSLTPVHLKILTS